MVYVLAIVGVGLAWLLLGKRDEPGSVLGREGAERDALAKDIKNRYDADAQQERMLLSAGEGAGGGLALGAVLGGPLGAAIGAGLGAFAGAIAQALGEPHYGRAVRDGLRDWLASHDKQHDAPAVDALIYRNALLETAWVWYRESDGALAFEVLEVLANGDILTSLHRGDGAFLPGMAAAQAIQEIMGTAPGMLDGPNRRAAWRDWKSRARPGNLYVIGVAAPSDSWRTPGYVFFTAGWPYRGEARVANAGSRGWERVTATPENVDKLAASFDHAVGARF